MNQTQNNPFIAFGTPSRVVINGLEEKQEDIQDCIDALVNHYSEVKNFTIKKIHNVVTLYVVTM